MAYLLQVKLEAKICLSIHILPLYLQKKFLIFQEFCNKILVRLK